MTAQFSGAIKVGDVSDFIAPSQACVVKLDGSKVQLQDESLAEAGSVALQPSKQSAQQVNKGFQQTQLGSDGTSVKVTLQDCLACSGCVTSAETVLLEHQSIAELRAKLQEPGVAVIASVSPQSRASLAEHFHLNPEQALRKLTTFFQQLGIAHVLDTTASRDFSLRETAAEFLHRYRLSHPDAAEQSKAGLTAEAGHLADDRTNGAAAPADVASRRHKAGQLPMLASACPGWVCYAEKTHGSVVLPNISTAKSPQAVMGTLVKHIVCQQLGLQPANTYHFAVMPCYDKKLEASRSDFTLPGGAVAEVDSVLTTVEVAEMLEQQGADFATLPEAPLQPLLPGIPVGAHLTGYPGGAGGYLEYVFRTAARELFGQEVPPGPLPLQPVRNADYKELKLEVNGKVVLRFAAVYGFRNIQTLMRKLKSDRCEYHYAEVMACPSGCLNGGGQLKPRAGQTQQQLIAALDEAYHHADIMPREPDANPLVQQLYQQRFGGAAFSSEARQLLHTQYHVRKKSAATVVASDW